MAYKDRLFIPSFSESSYLDYASNSNFKLGNLIRNKPNDVDHHELTPMDKIARHVIRHGEMPKNMHTNNPNTNNGENQEEDNKDVVKEDYRMSIYSAHLFRPGLREEGDATGIAQATGLGIPRSTANNLNSISINQYADSDASFIGDGDSAETSKTNIPALLAAKNAGGKPHPFVVSNGINKRSGTEGFKLKPLRDDLGPNG